METVTPVKVMKPVVSRVFRCYEQKGKTPRIVTISYEYDRNKKTIKYGASIYRQDEKDTDTFSKKGHLQTAIGRMERRPVIVEAIDDTGNLVQFNKMIRRLVTKYGVCGKERVKDTKEEAKQELVV